MRIKNNDIFHHKLEGKLLISNASGKLVGETEIRKTTILPGRIRKIPVEFEPEIPKRLKWLPSSISNFLIQNTPFGNYQVVLGLKEEKAGLLVDQGFSFFAFPWKIILCSLFFVVLAILGRKRVKIAIKALIKP